MRIAYAAHSFYPGNVPFYVHTQCLAEMGVEVHALALRRPDDPLLERVGRVYVHRVLGDLNRLHRSRAYWLDYVRCIQRALLAFPELDVVHVGNFAGASMLPLTNHRRRTGWVLDIRSPALHGRWRSTISNLRMRIEARTFDAVLVHARSVGEEIFGRWSSRLVELPIGVDFDHFTPGRNENLRQALGVTADETVLVYSGSLSPLRQLDRLLQGFMQANQGSESLHLLVIGEGGDLPRLRSLAAELGIQQRIHFAGFVPYPAVPDYLRAADIGLGYVPITPWYDKAPVLKTMEALAMGLPTIATNTHGNRAYVRDGENGLLVEDAPAAIARAILTLCADVELSNHFRRSARDSVRAYDFRTIVRDILLPTYERVYARLHAKRTTA